MVFAQRQRLRDLQHGSKADVFAPDVLVNMLIVIFIPAIFFVFGNYGLTWLYLFNALVALVFYWMMDVERAAKLVSERHASKLRAVIGALLVMPVFASLETGLFRDSAFIYDSGGALGKLPIPLSIIACYVGIALLGNYRRASLGLGVIFGSFVLMVLSTVATTHDDRPAEQAKLLLLLQYIIPMFGLVLGMMFEEHKLGNPVVEKALLLVIAILMPAQLLASWAQLQMLLTPYLYLFSIYQHLQYVPVIIVSCYLVTLFSLWSIHPWRALTIVLAPVVGIYTAASGSIAAAVFLLAGSAAFGLYTMGTEKGRRRHIMQWTVITLVSGAGIAYAILASWVTKHTGVTVAHGVGPVGLYTQKIPDGALLYAQSRVDTWFYYLHGIYSEPLTFLFGHSIPPDRQIWPSAHNYYLDLIYNYGVIATLMIAGLIVFTISRIIQNRRFILRSPAMVGLAMVVLFLLIPDNLVKVSMRQPYSGIIIFFLWGLLLARIESLRPAGKHRPAKSAS